MTKRRSVFLLLHHKMERAGFVFEKEQQPHMQNRKEKELKFVHPVLEQRFKELQLKNLARKFYIKPLSDDENSEVGLTTGKTSPLFLLEEFPTPNAVDTFNNNHLPNAWVNREGDESLDRLLNEISEFVLPSRDSLEEEFRAKVKESLTSNSTLRNERLRKAPKKAVKKTSNDFHF